MVLEIKSFSYIRKYIDQRYGKSDYPDILGITLKPQYIGHKSAHLCYLPEDVKATILCISSMLGGHPGDPSARYTVSRSSKVSESNIGQEISFLVLPTRHLKHVYTFIWHYI